MPIPKPADVRIYEGIDGTWIAEGPKSGLIVNPPPDWRPAWREPPIRERLHDAVSRSAAWLILMAGALLAGGALSWLLLNILLDLLLRFVGADGYVFRSPHWPER